ncbi:MAG: RNA polymerase Rpb6 [Bacteroidetes bacterium GWF2_40_14]|jgi:DNA-directed RNA polymerase subunit K/omega|nr:MAG: RNA polymerase Rpb6 [Bacteroidetes bacterium GWF2_40_14]
MEIKKQVPNNTITRDLSKLAAPTGNIYESVIIIAKRANQISAEVKQELSQKLDEFSNYADTLEETFENREQIEISRYYEKLPKPSLMAISEFEEGQIYYRKIEG